jgi:hypothetical protein
VDHGCPDKQVAALARGLRWVALIVLAVGSGAPANASPVPDQVAQEITSPASLETVVNAQVGFTVTATGSPTPSLSVAGVWPPGWGWTFSDHGDGTATLTGTPIIIGGVFHLTITASNGVSPDATQDLSSFSCRDGAGGPGVRSCLDQHQRHSGALLDTATVGTHTLTVTAKSKNGLVRSKTVNYRVLAPVRVQVSTIRAIAIQRQLRLTLGGALRADGKLARSASGKITVAFMLRLPRGTAHGSAQAAVTHGRWHVSIVLPAVNHNATHRTYRITIRYSGDQTHGHATTQRRLRL